MEDVERWVGNSLATLLAAAAIGAGVIGLLLAFGYINDDATNPFQDGVIWLSLGLILGLAAHVFRREHNVVDDKSLRSQLGEGGGWKNVDDERGRNIGSRAK